MGSASAGTSGLLSGFNDSIGDGGRKLAAAGETTAVIGPLLWLLGKLIVLVSTMISWPLLLLTLLRDFIQSFGRPGVGGSGVSAVIACALVFWFAGKREGFAPAGQLPFDLRRHRHRDPADGARPRWIACRRYQAVGRLAGDVGGVGDRHCRLDAGRHCACARPALDHSIDPDFLDCLYRDLARGSADHCAVLRHLYAAAIRSDRIHHRRIGARFDRDRAVYRRLSGRKHPWRPGGDLRGQGEAASALGLSWATRPRV